MDLIGTVIELSDMRIKAAQEGFYTGLAKDYARATDLQHAIFDEMMDRMAELSDEELALYKKVNNFAHATTSHLQKVASGEIKSWTSVFTGINQIEEELRSIKRDVARM